MNPLRTLLIALVTLGIGLVGGAVLFGDDGDDDEGQTVSASRPPDRLPQGTAGRAEDPLGSGGGGGGQDARTPRPRIGIQAAASGVICREKFVWEPYGLNARPENPSDSTIVFSWRQHCFKDSFDAYRWNGSGWDRIAHRTTWGHVKDTGLQPGQTYHYTVCARRQDQVACSPAYATATTKTTPPPAPTALSASPSGGNGGIRFQWTQPCWNHPCTAIASFQAYRYHERGGQLRAWNLGGDTKHVIDDQVQPGQTYLYNVCAMNAYGRSCANYWVRGRR